MKKTRKTTAQAAQNEKKEKKPTNKSFDARFPPNASPAAKALATNVRRLREKLKLSQAALADKAKADQAAISLIELGRSNPTLKLIQAIAKALGTNCSTLLK